MGLLSGPTFPWRSKTIPRERIFDRISPAVVDPAPASTGTSSSAATGYGDLSGLAGFGGFAEYVCAPAKLLAPMSPRMTFAQAAALPQAGQLAVQGIAAAGPLKPRQTILINGAGGGVGTIGVQLAKSQMPDVDVIGVDSALKFETMRRAGFDHVIDFTTEDFTSNGRQHDRSSIRGQRVDPPTIWRSIRRHLRDRRRSVDPEAARYPARRLAYRLTTARRSRSSA